MNVPECQVKKTQNLTLLISNLIAYITNAGVCQMPTLDGNRKCLPLNNHEQRGDTLEREIKSEQPKITL